MITLAVGIFLAYCLIIAIIYGVQPSISESFYTTKEKLYFTLVFMVVFSLIIVAVKPNPYFIVASCFFGLVGGAANYKTKLWIANKMHFIGVIGAVISFVVGFIVIDWQIGLASMLLIAILVSILWDVKNHIWWQEIATILVIYITLMYLQYTGKIILAAI